MKTTKTTQTATTTTTATAAAKEKLLRQMARNEAKLAALGVTAEERKAVEVASRQSAANAVAAGKLANAIEVYRAKTKIGHEVLALLGLRLTTDGKIAVRGTGETVNGALGATSRVTGSDFLAAGVSAFVVGRETFALASGKRNPFDASAVVMAACRAVGKVQSNSVVDGKPSWAVTVTKNTTIEDVRHGSSAVVVLAQLASIRDAIKCRMAAGGTKTLAEVLTIIGK
jgi:hypothetical protein